MGLERVLDARSVAVIGASRDDRKRGYRALKGLLDSGFEGAIYPVNPKEETILGLRCYPELAAIDGVVDLVLLVTPAESINGLIDECGGKGVGGVVIVAAGFSETGARGRRRQEKLVDRARDLGVRIVGPNTSGLINVHSGLNLVGLADVPAGDIALISQSGNMALHLITEARIKSHKGFSYYVGVGNEADISFAEYLRFFADDPKTRAVVMYVEGMRDGRAFLQQAYRTTRLKPIILLASGRSATGSRSAGSHTGALAGSPIVGRSAFERAGIITIQNSDELFPAAEALASLPPVANNKIAILADGGGHATIAADVLTDHGVGLPRLRRRTQRRLREILSPNASVLNPIDVAGSTDMDPGIFARCARILLDDTEIGGLLLVGLFGGYATRFSERLAFIEEDTAHQLGKLVQQTGKPIAVHSLYKFERPHSLELLRYYGIPVHDSVEVACKCLAVLSSHGQYLSTYERRTSFVLDWGKGATAEGRALIENAVKERRKALEEPVAKRLLGLHGAPVAEEFVARTPREAATLAERIGGPVALKLISHDILHKSDAGGVKLGLEGRDAVLAAYDEIIANARRYRPDASILGCLVSPMADPGTEVIVGSRRDRQFGPVIMFGIGGILVEVLKDVVFRVLPISRRAAREMVDEIRAAPILNGTRGQPPADKEALVDLLLTVGAVVEAYPEIEEMDLNPVIAREDGLTVVDARVLLKA